jgi:hypothetical protein
VGGPTWYAYPAPYYAYPYSPPVYGPIPPGFYFYCPGVGYYPYVAACPTGWVSIPVVR